MAKDEFDYGPFKVGDVVQLYRQDAGTDDGLQWLLGEELEITEPLGVHPNCDGDYLAYGVQHVIGYPFYAGVNEVRRPRPPASGIQDVDHALDAPPVERRAPVTAWQAQYDTAQALMTMGVRVKPGAWPVEVA